MKLKADKAPLFEVCLELQNNDIVFVPSLNPAVDEDDPYSFYALVSGLLEDIVHMSIRVPRISYNMGSLTYMVRNKIVKGFFTRN